MQSEPRPIRGWALVLPVLVTIFVGAGLGGFVVLQDIRENERIVAADDAAAEYLNEVALFRAGVVEALTSADQDDPAALREALDAAIVDPPTLPDVESSAAEQSSTYAEAERVAEVLLDPYTELSDSLEKAVTDQKFIQAARKALEMRATDYVDTVLLDSSNQVRGSLIPAFVAARDEFNAVRVPSGAEEAARLTVAALQEVIAKATALADSIDNNRSYTFAYGESFRIASSAVDNYAAQANGDLTEALNTVRDLR